MHRLCVYLSPPVPMNVEMFVFSSSFRCRRHKTIRSFGQSKHGGDRIDGTLKETVEVKRTVRSFALPCLERLQQRSPWDDTWSSITPPDNHGGVWMGLVKHAFSYAELHRKKKKKSLASSWKTGIFTSASLQKCDPWKEPRWMNDYFIEAVVFLVKT